MMKWIKRVGGPAAVILVLIIWVTWASLSYTAPEWLRSAPADKLGVWGDSFGALSSLFTALAFLAVVAGFRLQRLQMSRGQDEQHRQRFDNWYFELLRLLRESRDAIEFGYGPEYIKAKAIQVSEDDEKAKQSAYRIRLKMRIKKSGVDAFKIAWFELKYHLDLKSYPVTREVAGKIYTRYIHNRNESVFGPYFRILYTILESIDSDKVLTLEEKYRYGRLLRSQLTSYEVALAGFNGLSDLSKDFDRLVIEFRLLKYLPSGRRKRFLRDYYPEEAFKARD